MSKLSQPLGPGDHIRGPADASVTLVEYGDYECPHCGHASPIVEEVLRRVGPSVRFAFRHFPLTEIHPHALEAAEAAECAGAQRKFWPMHHQLFSHQEALEPEDLLGYAEALELDAERFARDLAAHTHLEKVKGDFRSGMRSGVNGTPTFFIDGVRFDAPWDLETLTTAVQAALLGEK